MLALILILGFAGWELITPKNAQECGLMYELADRAVCAERFALSKADMRICRDIDFRSVQYDCMERVAQMLRKPELCEEIKAPPGARITRFEVKPDIFKDTCYYGLALSLHDKGLCGKIGDEKMTAACKGRMSTAGTIDPPEGVRGDGSGLPPQ